MDGMTVEKAEYLLKCAMSTGKIDDMELSKAKGYLERDAQLRPLLEELTQFLEHDKMCIRSFQEAGEPTENGGYRTKFKGAWYETRPVDRTPKCDCGLDEAWDKYQKSMGFGK